MVKNKPVQKQTKPALSHLLTVSIKDTAGVISSLSFEKKVPPHSVENSNTITSSFKRDMTGFTVVQAKKEKEEFTTQKITINTALPVDTVINIVAIIPEKKKLKVVHINELGDPVEDVPNMVRSHERRSLVKFINQEVNICLPSSGNTGFNIFKAKKIPSN